MRRLHIWGECPTVFPGRCSQCCSWIYTVLSWLQSLKGWPTWAVSSQTNKVGSQTWKRKQRKWWHCYKLFPVSGLVKFLFCNGACSKITRNLICNKREFSFPNKTITICCNSYSFSKTWLDFKAVSRHYESKNEVGGPLSLFLSLPLIHSLVSRDPHTHSGSVSFTWFISSSHGSSIKQHLLLCCLSATRLVVWVKLPWSTDLVLRQLNSTVRGCRGHSRGQVKGKADKIVNKSHEPNWRWMQQLPVLFYTANSVVSLISLTHLSKGIYRLFPN